MECNRREETQSSLQRSSRENITKKLADGYWDGRHNSLISRTDLASYQSQWLFEHQDQVSILGYCSRPTLFSQPTFLSQLNKNPSKFD